MLELTEWVTRISTPQVKADLAANVDTAQQAKNLPSVAVVPGRETVISAPLSGGAVIRHRVAAEVLVVTGVRRGNQFLGGGMVDELAALRRPTLTSLIDWLPTGMDIEVAWQGGRLLSLNSSALFWVDAFKTEYWWTNE
ncbi:MAG: hypothetical protein HLX50_07635 [Alteromonadaceae bacterium]|nr:hypothetical protein [Alteromonadaceae bacterium]